MRSFRTRFSADIGPYKQQMSEMRQVTGRAGGAIRSMFAAGAAAAGGWSLAAAIRETARLGGELQNTATSFEVMLGSAKEAERVLAQLNRFADVTPFDNEEVIRSGRILLNVGVGVDGLKGKLTMLGDIAAGVKAPLTDIVNIYAKAANKGKVQAEELAQLSERGVPVLKALSQTLGVTTEEVMALGAKGKLSFALLDEALASLSGKGGQYFGLMERQSQNFLAKVDGIRIAVRNFATDVGSRSLPALTKIADEVIAKLDELSESGELDAMAQRLADAIGKTAVAARDLAVWLAKNKDNFIALGKAALYYAAWLKLSSAITSAQKALALFGAGGGVSGLRRSSDTVRLLTADVKALTRTIGGVQTGLLALGPAVTTAFAGWELGKFLGNLLGVEDALLRIELRKQGMSEQEINDRLSGKDPAKDATPAVAGRDLAADEERKEQLRREIGELERKAAEVSAAPVPEAPAQGPQPAGVKARDLAADEDRKRSLESEIAALEKRAHEAGLAGREAEARSIGTEADMKREALADLEDANAAYQRAAEEEIGRIAELERKAKAARDRYEAARKAGGKPVMTEHGGRGPAVEARRRELEEAEKELQKAQQTERDYNAAVGALRNAETGGEAADPGQAREGRSRMAQPLLDEAAAKRRELDDLKKSGEEYRKQVEAQIAAIPELEKSARKAEREYLATSRKMQEARQPGGAWGGVMGTGGQTVTGSISEASLKKKHEEQYKAVQQAKADLEAAKKAQAEYEASKKALEESQRKKADRKSASDQFRADRAKEQAAAADEEKKKQAELEKQRKRAEQQVADARKEVAKARRSIGDEAWRDTMSEKIAAWRKNIAGYQQDIDKTNKKLGRFGLNVKDDILKSKDQIKQDKADDELTDKIARYNRGEKVRFSKKEKERIAQLQREQAEARGKQAQARQAEDNIDQAEEAVSARDKQRRAEDRKERASEADKKEQAANAAEKAMEEAKKAEEEKKKKNGGGKASAADGKKRPEAVGQKEKTLPAAEQQIKAMKEANAATEELLKKIADILKNGLPNGD